MIVFNFHHVERQLKNPERKHITVSPEGLRRFIRTLRTLGLEIISMRDVLSLPDPAWDSSRQVLLTFDDGYENNYEFAAPVLFEEDCPATIFALPGRLGGTNVWDQGGQPEATRDRLMSLAQMQELGQNPLITFGSHGMLHRDMTKLNDAELAADLQESHRILADALGEAYLPVLAYPWGYYDPRVLQAVAASPYQYAFTVETKTWQSGQPRFEIPRFSAYYRDGNPVIFLAKLARHKLLFA